MRRALVALAVMSWAAAAQAGIVNDFGDIRYWAGSGTNQAGFVLDFGTAAPQGAPPAVAWGYRWNGTASLDQLIFSLAGTISGSGAPAPVAGSDPRLGVAVTYYPDYNGPGAGEYTVDGLAYDQVGLPAGWSQELRTLENDYFNDRSIANYMAPNAGGVWPVGGALQVAGVGPIGTVLTDGGWYGYVVAQYDPLDNYAFPDPLAFSQPTAAIPEPATIVLAIAGIGFAGLGLRRRCDRATLGEAGLWPRHPGSPS